MPARTPPRFRLSPTLLAVLASGILLSGCDLWGGPDAPSNNASVSSTGEEEPVVVAQMEEASSANGSYLFGTSGRTEDGAYQGLDIVDPANGQELDGYPVLVDADSGQIASQAFTMPDSGGAQISGDNVELFLVRDHKVYKVSLLKPLLPRPVQVSSEMHVCSLLKVIPKDSHATTSWILLRATRDDTGDCTDSDQVVNKMVSSDAASDAPASNADQIGQVLTVERDGSGQLIGLLALAPLLPGQSSFKLVQMQGSDGVVSPVELNLPAGASASYFERVAGSTTQAYLRVSNGVDAPSLRVLDWATGTPALLPNAPVIPLTLGEGTFVHTDASANYYVDGITLKSLKPGASASTVLATLQKAPQAGGVMTASYLVVPQIDDQGNVSLQAFSKTKPNSARDIKLSQAGGLVSVVAHNGDVLIVSQALDPNSPQVTLWRVDLGPAVIPDPTSLTPVPVTLISATQAAKQTVSGEQQQANVIWSQALSDTTLSLSSYQLSSNQTAVLGDNVTSWDRALISPLTITQGLLTSSTGPTDTLWLFDASKATSLTPVQPAAEPR